MELRSPSRRAMIIGAGFATAAPALVRAESLLAMPGDPLSKRGLFAAAKWATEEFCERPGCRVVFADGQTTRWNTYSCMSRPQHGGPADVRTYVVAMEICVSDERGQRFITSVPITNALELDKGIRASAYSDHPINMNHIARRFAHLMGGLS